jgi:hypothetical protein
MLAGRLIERALMDVLITAKSSKKNWSNKSLDKIWHNIFFAEAGGLNHCQKQYWGGPSS